GGLDYSPDTKNMLKSLGVNDKYLPAMIKPGEALGPLCLIKRALYYRFSQRNSIFDSTDNVAFAWYAVHGNDVGQRIVNNKECDKVKKYIEPTNGARDTTYLCDDPLKCTLEDARNIFNKCIDVDNDLLKNVWSDLSNKLGVKLNLDIINPDKSLLMFRSNYGILKGDADNIGKLSTGEIPVEKNYYNLLTKELPNVNRTMECKYNTIYNIMNSLGGFIVSFTYLMTLSMSLITTSLKDIRTTNYKYYSTPVSSLIFSAGDDVLALVPVELALSIIGDMRRNYWGDKNGFHKIGNYYMPTPAVNGFGKSFSVRFVNIMDNMKNEIKATIRELEETSKRSIWELGSDKFNKDSLTISESRTNVKAVFPLSLGTLSDVAEMVSVLNKLFIARLGHVISSNLPEDSARYMPIINELIYNNKHDMLYDIWTMLIRRNIMVLNYVKDDIVKEFSLSSMKIDSNIRLKFDERSSEAHPLYELINAYKILRGYP
ncbi:MAG: type III-B CRISPR-associated protein Cas10/Cmr2, partial [Thermocladium sp.]